MRPGHILILAGVFFLYGCRSHRAAGVPSSEPAASDSTRTTVANPTAAADPTDTPTVRDKRPVIVCFGDSLTAGYGTDPGLSYPDFLQADLDSLGYHYRVVNEGISGNTTKDGLERIDTIVDLKPAIIIVEFGGNDGLRGLPISQSRENLDKILATLKPTGAKLILAGITLPPDYGPDYIKQFDDTYVLLAKKYRIPMLPFLLQGVFGVDGMMQADHTHATAKGNKVVAKNILPLILPLLKK